jgi:predicted Zn-dependent protease with MMP-like domain
MLVNVTAMSLTSKSRATTSERSINGSDTALQAGFSGLPWTRVGDLEQQQAASDFEQVIRDTLDSVPHELRDRMSNVEIVVDEEPPPGQRLLGLYQGIPLTQRGINYSGTLPDKITIYRGPLERHYGYDPELLTQNIRRVVLHEIAHHFGISDDRLIEIDRY